MTVADADRPFRIHPEKLVLIGLDTQDGAEHPLWDERIALPIDEPMVLSIMAIGVRVPVEVLVQSGRYIVVDGRQRTRNAREANKRLILEGEPPLTVPIVATQGSRLSEEMASLIATTLNEIRSGDPFLVRARRAQRLLERGFDRRAVATAFGQEPPTIDGWLLVLNAAPEVIESVAQKVIPPTSAIELARAPLADQPAALAMLLASPRPTRKRARKAAAGKSLSPLRAHGAVGQVLKRPNLFHPEFVRGVRFAADELSPEETAEIVARLESV